jgi:hypothetical protein
MRFDAGQSQGRRWTAATIGTIHLNGLTGAQSLRGGCVGVTLGLWRLAKGRVTDLGLGETAKGSKNCAERVPFRLDHWSHDGGEHVGPNYGNDTSDCHQNAGEQLAPVASAIKIRKMSGSFRQ